MKCNLQWKKIEQNEVQVIAGVAPDAMQGSLSLAKITCSPETLTRERSTSKSRKLLQL